MSKIFYSQQTYDGLEAQLAQLKEDNSMHSKTIEHLKTENRKLRTDVFINDVEIKKHQRTIKQKDQRIKALLKEVSKAEKSKNIF